MNDVEGDADDDDASKNKVPIYVPFESPWYSGQASESVVEAAWQNPIKNIVSYLCFVSTDIGIRFGSIWLHIAKYHTMFVWCNICHLVQHLAKHHSWSIDRMTGRFLYSFIGNHLDEFENIELLQIDRHWGKRQNISSDLPIEWRNNKHNSMSIHVPLCLGCMQRIAVMLNHSSIDK